VSAGCVATSCVNVWLLIPPIFLTRLPTTGNAPEEGFGSASVDTTLYFPKSTTDDEPVS
jgi:hypothetical protein